jgi:hypothetical protein
MDEVFKHVLETEVLSDPSIKFRKRLESVPADASVVN